MHKVSAQKCDYLKSIFFLSSVDYYDHFVVIHFIVPEGRHPYLVFCHMLTCDICHSSLFFLSENYIYPVFGEVHLYMLAGFMWPPDLAGV